MDLAAVSHIHHTGAGDIAIAVEFAASSHDELRGEVTFIRIAENCLFLPENQPPMISGVHAGIGLTVALPLTVDVDLAIAGEHCPGGKGQRAVSKVCNIIVVIPAAGILLLNIVVRRSSLKRAVIICREGDQQLHSRRDLIVAGRNGTII